MKIQSKARSGVIALVILLVVYQWWDQTYPPARGFVTGRGNCKRIDIHAAASQLAHHGAYGCTMLAEKGSAQIKLMLSSEEKEQLLELGYTEEETSSMRVELAVAVIEKGTKRPWGDKPMPETWQSEAASIKGQEIKGTSLDMKGDENPKSFNITIRISIGQVLAGLALLIATVAFVSSSPWTTPWQDALPEYTLRSS